MRASTAIREWSVPVAIMAWSGLWFILLGVPDRGGWTPPATGARQTRQRDTVEVRLTEVLFAPKGGDTAFVELVNTGSRPVDLSALVLRVDTLDLPLPRLSPPLAPGALAVVRFDGRATVEGTVIHAPQNYSLNPDAGTLALHRRDDARLDRVGRRL